LIFFSGQTEIFQARYIWFLAGTYEEEISLQENKIPKAKIYLKIFILSNSEKVDLLEYE